LHDPNGSKWVALLLYLVLGLFVVNYGALRRYCIKCWIFFEAIIHHGILRPGDSQRALLCLIIYGPFYVFLLDHSNFFQWHMKGIRFLLYLTSIVVFLCYTCSLGQFELLLLGVAASISPLYYYLEQTWWWN
jgi:uncharacterized membrane protein SirB2